MCDESMEISFLEKYNFKKVWNLEISIFKSIDCFKMYAWFVCRFNTFVKSIISFTPIQKDPPTTEHKNLNKKRHKAYFSLYSQ